jgi:hypothetical protein
MRADAERLAALDDEYRRATSAALQAQLEYRELLRAEVDDDKSVNAAWFRLWHAQQRQRELQAEMVAWHH